jgi:hypothetical protein
LLNDFDTDTEIFDELDIADEGDTDGIRVGVNPGDTDALCKDDIEFVFKELLDTDGLLEDEEEEDTEMLGLKLVVEVVEGHDDTIIELVNPVDTVIKGV